MAWLTNIQSKAFFLNIYEKALETDLFGRSAQVAFYFSFAFFPLLLFLVSLAGLVLDSREFLEVELYRYLAQILPSTAYDLVFSTMKEIVETSSGGKLTIGLFVTLWSASAGIDSLRDALNAVYETDEDRPWWKTKLQSIILTFLFILLLALAMGVVTIGIQFGNSLAGMVGIHFDSPWILQSSQWVAVLATMIFATAVVYSWLPSFEEFHWVWVSPGSVFAVILWVVLTGGFRVYLQYFNSYNKAYGSLGAVIILMLWMYLTGLALLVGGAVNSVLTEMAEDSGAKEAQKDDVEHKIRELTKEQSR